MKTMQWNKLEIGRIPRVVGTASSRETLSAFSATCRDHCDIVEVRLDEIGIFSGWEDACRTIEASGAPVILTLRSATEGGKGTQSEADRLQVFKQALSCASAIDVEFNSGLGRKIQSDIEASKKALLISHHDFSGTPALSDLRHIVQEASSFASVVKISTLVKGEEDISTLSDLLDEGASVPLCVIGMGAKGTRTRTSFPCLNSCLTYGYLDFVNAPGQLSARELVEYLRRVHPAYNEEFIINHELMECV